MKHSDLRNRIMVAVGAWGFAATACGGVENASGERPGTDTSTGGASTGGAPTSGSGGFQVGGGASGGFQTGGGASGRGPSTDAGSSYSIDAASRADGASTRAAADAAGDHVVVDAAVPACATYGEACTQSSDCCSGVPCNQGYPCTAPATCVCMYMTIRRPFLVGSSLRVAEATPRSDWQPGHEALDSAADLDPATAEALGQDWLRDGCEEHASIAAFARFTLHLMSVGAPPEMIVASQRAAVDEVRHARACFALARRYGGRAMGPAPLSLAGAMAPVTLAEIAALTAEEGCVGETLGALLAEEQLRRTTDPVVRSVLARANIVPDEGRHAELAWSFVAWAIAQGGEPVRRAVAVAIRRAVDDTLAMPIRTYDAIDVEAWRSHGRLTCADAHAVVERGVRDIIDPCTATLLGEPPPEVGVGGRPGASRDRIVDC
jgi:hypothetical protein